MVAVSGVKGACQPGGDNGCLYGYSQFVYYAYSVAIKVGDREHFRKLLALFVLCESAKRHQSESDC